MSASVLKCPDCYMPLWACVHPEDRSTVYVYCTTPMCNPLRIENLSRGKVKKGKAKKRVGSAVR